MSLQAEVTEWWVNLAKDEAGRVIPKAVEYGATDLVKIGAQLAEVAGWTGLDEADLAELGCYFYIVGKLARWSDAVRSKRKVSDDTLHDIGVYVRMVQHIREFGGWPERYDERKASVG